MDAADYTLASRVKLADGHTMPRIQLGLYMMSGPEARAAVATALEVGYRGFDCAQMYYNEREAGAAIRAALDEAEAEAKGAGEGQGRPRLTREDVFYTSKLAENSTSYAAVRASIRESVEACGLGYIDLFLLHSPYGGRRARLTSWRAIEDAIAAGEVRSGGVSNFGAAHLEELMAELSTTSASPRVRPVVNQIETHPFNTRADLRAASTRHGLVVEAYAPLVRGRRMQHAVVRALARRYGCTPAQLLVRWSLQHGMVPLPKTTHRARMVENADVAALAIAPADMARLDALDEHLVTDWDPTDAP